MPAKIQFHVIYATSEDSSYPACELNSHGPTVRGWRSAVDALEPHELLLRLTVRTGITKIQLLAHQHYIPMTVELLVYDPDPSESAVQTPCGAMYTNVGHMELSPPAVNTDGVPIDSAGTSPLRELKTAILPETIPARFLRLKMSGPHNVCSFNTTRQVALMAVNILGYEISESGKTDLHDANTKYSPYDDLTFVMYMDTDVAYTVKKLERKKQSAITDERFEYARKIKVAITSLLTVGQRLGRWALRKRLAALAEDYEEARIYRDRLTVALVALNGDMLLERLLEEDGMDSVNDELSAEDIDFSSILKLKSEKPAIAAEKSKSWLSFRSAGRDKEMKKNEDNPRAPLQNMTVTINNVPTVFRASSEALSKTADNDRIDISTNCPSANLKTVDNRVDFISMYTNGTDSYANSPVNSPSPTNVLLSRRRSTMSPTNLRAVKTDQQVRMRPKTGSPHRQNRNSYEDYEERAVPALRHSNTNEYLRECQITESELSKSSSKLNEKEKKQAALPILIFGEALVEKFYSKNFTEKEEGLHRLRFELLSYETRKTAAITPTAHKNASFSGTKTSYMSPNKTGRAAMFLIHRSIRDKVFSVYNLATELIKIFFTEFVPDRICPAEVVRSVDRILPELLSKAGDPAPRINSLAIHTILTMAECHPVRSLYIIPQYLMRAISGNSHPRMALSRLEMIEQIVLSQGLGKDKQSGLTVRKVAEVAAVALTHASAGVRAVAERLLVTCYERAPRIVRSQLPPDDNVSRRNLLYRNLFQQFDKIDTEKTFLSNVDDLSTLGAVQYSNGHSSAPSKMASSLTSSLFANSLTNSMANPMFSSVINCSKDSKRYSRQATRNRSDTIGYNKLRLDSAASPKHRVRISESFRNGWRDSADANTVVKNETKECRAVIGDVSANNTSMIKVKSTQSLCVYENDSTPANGTTDSVAPKVIKSKSGSNISNAAQSDDCSFFDSFDESQFEENLGGKGSNELSVATTRSDTSTPEYDITLEGVLCDFCLMAVSGNLDEHYWKQCPLLARCLSCNDVVEARLYDLHLKDNCTERKSFKICVKCQQPIHLASYDQHLKDNSCIETPLKHNKCPHCRLNIPEEEESWRSHLMPKKGSNAGIAPSVETCKANPRVNSAGDATDP